MLPSASKYIKKFASCWVVSRHEKQSPTILLLEQNFEARSSFLQFMRSHQMTLLLLPLNYPYYARNTSLCRQNKAAAVTWWAHYALEVCTIILQRNRANYILKSLIWVERHTVLWWDGSIKILNQHALKPLGTNFGAFCQKWMTWPFFGSYLLH